MMYIDLPCSQFTRAVAQYRAKKMAQVFRMECTCSRITNSEGISVYRLQLRHDRAERKSAARCFQCSAEKNTQSAPFLVVPLPELFSSS